MTAPRGWGWHGCWAAQLRLRAGVAAGDVIVGLVGGQPSAYGLPVNYARRLCDAAQPGETLACAWLSRSLVGQSPGPGVAAVRCGPLCLPSFGAGCQVDRLSLLDQPGAQAYPAQLA